MQAALQSLYRAMPAHDLPALASLLTGDAVYVHSTGLAETKIAFPDGARDGLYVYERVRPVKDRIEISGDLGVVYSVLDFMGGARGAVHPAVTLITTLVWRRESGVWRMAVPGDACAGCGYFLNLKGPAGPVTNPN